MSEVVLGKGLKNVKQMMTVLDSCPVSASSALILARQCHVVPMPIVYLKIMLRGVAARVDIKRTKMVHVCHNVKGSSAA